MDVSLGRRLLRFPDSKGNHNEGVVQLLQMQYGIIKLWLLSLNWFKHQILEYFMKVTW